MIEARVIAVVAHDHDGTPCYHTQTIPVRSLEHAADYHVPLSIGYRLVSQHVETRHITPWGPLR